MGSRTGQDRSNEQGFPLVDELLVRRQRLDNWLAYHVAIWGQGANRDFLGRNAKMVSLIILRSSDPSPHWYNSQRRSCYVEYASCARVRNREE